MYHENSFACFFYGDFKYFEHCNDFFYAKYARVYIGWISIRASFLFLGHFAMNTNLRGFSHSSLAQTRFCYEVQDETFCNKSLSVNELKASLPLFGSKIEFAYWARKLISFSFHCEWSSIQQINLSYPSAPVLLQHSTFCVRKKFSNKFSTAFRIVSICLEFYLFNFFILSSLLANFQNTRK